MKKEVNQSSFAMLLRSKGFKATPSRLALLKLLKDSRKPLTVEEISETGIDADYATIYRSLKDLKEAGIVRQVDLQHRHAHYELASSDHHHLICMKCGRVEDFPSSQTQPLIKSAMKQSKQFQAVTQLSLEFFGICKTCAAKASK